MLNHSKKTKAIVKKAMELFQWIEQNGLPKYNSQNKEEKTYYLYLINLRQSKKGNGKGAWHPIIEELLKQHLTVPQDLFDITKSRIKKGKEHKDSIIYNFDLIHKNGNIRKGPIEGARETARELGINNGNFCSMLKQAKCLHEGKEIKTKTLVKSVGGWSIKWE